MRPADNQRKVEAFFKTSKTKIHTSEELAKATGLPINDAVETFVIHEMDQRHGWELTDIDDGTTG